jgi:N-acetylglucosaminyl-diphospho-decaprenol L-rhamnosyltransferase
LSTAVASTSRTATVIVPSLTGERLGALLDSLAAQTVEHQVIVVDNGCPDGSVRDACARHPVVERVRLERNAGFSRAVNVGAARAEGDALVMVNDDVVCDPPFVAELTDALAPASGVVMATGVLRNATEPERIDTAGIELDRTLMLFDYLNGEPLSRLEDPVADPLCPVGAAAAIDAGAFRDVGGFDERIFAYWEEVDLSLRILQGGGRCRLAPRALGDHRHSATLGVGSVGKNYLTGFGRGYVLRKWNVVTPGRLPAVLVRELAVCAAHAVLDRNLASARGRVRGYRAADPSEPYPAELLSTRGVTAVEQLAKRVRRRRSVRRQRMRAVAQRD